MAEPTNSDLLRAIGDLHGDIKVALDRTVHHADELETLFQRTNQHAIEIAKAKGSAATIGLLVSGAVVGVIELARSWFSVGGGHH